MEPTHAQTDQSHAFDLNTLSLPEFAAYLRRSGYPKRLIELARDEDLGHPMHDWTGEMMFDEDDTRRVQMRSREDGIVSGIEFIADLIEVFDPTRQIQWSSQIQDGTTMTKGTVLAEFSGNARVIVRLERTMLNLISRMCGIATLTREFVDQVQGTPAKICDTRKTTPGLRAFEKYAGRCGGGTTHRMGLYDAMLIKDNHLSMIKHQDLATRIGTASYKVQKESTHLWFVQVEVDTLDQLEQVLRVQAGAVDIVLLDNMSTDQLTRAVEMRNESDSRCLLESSGGVSIKTVSGIARTGVDRISIGALTHQAQSLDIGLDAF